MCTAPHLGTRTTTADTRVSRAGAQSSSPWATGSERCGWEAWMSPGQTSGLSAGTHGHHPGCSGSTSQGLERGKPSVTLRGQPLVSRETAGFIPSGASGCASAFISVHASQREQRTASPSCWGMGWLRSESTHVCTHIEAQTQAFTHIHTEIHI